MAEKPFELINLEKLDMAEKFSSIRLKLIGIIEAQKWFKANYLFFKICIKFSVPFKNDTSSLN